MQFTITQFTITVAGRNHYDYAESICEMMQQAAEIRGTGIAKREPDYVRQKMAEGKAVIALNGDEVAGFCYIESWEQQKYVANSGLIVHPDYRKTGLAKSIKRKIFELTKQTYPNAKLFGITTSIAVMKINSDLGYKPVTFSELTQDDNFWKGCQSCTNYDILQRTGRKMCLCTAMVCDLKSTDRENEKHNSSWDNFMRFVKLQNIRIRRKTNHFLNPNISGFLSHRLSVFQKILGLDR